MVIEAVARLEIFFGVYFVNCLLTIITSQHIFAIWINEFDFSSFVEFQGWSASYPWFEDLNLDETMNWSVYQPNKTQIGSIIWTNERRGIEIDLVCFK